MTVLQRPPRARRGYTLVEQLVLLALSGTLLGLGVVGGGRLLDAAAVRSAASDVADVFAVARDQATATGQRTAVRISAPEGRVVVHADIDTLLRLELLSTRGISVETTRDSMAYSASGLGYGASNLRVVVRRGSSADTVSVSRLGRVRR